MKIRIYCLRFWAIGGWFTVAWIGAGIAVGGIGLNLIGQNKQAQANQDAIAANQAAQAEQNRLQWSNYLMTRGIAPTGAVTPGVLPSAGNFRVVNSRLPLWATVSSSNGPARWVKAGTVAPSTTWTLAPST